eukprot:GHVN01099646.1.p1 GENE.GHVN01099646.1~~GHVN01099646.1.p1  ORF type:complete len:335 (+),score=53.03 GHVN01099646.1:311-1315(+)
MISKTKINQKRPSQCCSCQRSKNTTSRRCLNCSCARQGRTCTSCPAGAQCHNTHENPPPLSNPSSCKPPAKPPNNRTPTRPTPPPAPHLNSPTKRAPATTTPTPATHQAHHITNHDTSQEHINLTTPSSHTNLTSYRTHLNPHALRPPPQSKHQHSTHSTAHPNLTRIWHSTRQLPLLPTPTLLPPPPPFPLLPRPALLPLPHQLPAPCLHLPHGFLQPTYPTTNRPYPPVSSHTGNGPATPSHHGELRVAPTSRAPISLSSTQTHAAWSPITSYTKYISWPQHTPQISLPYLRHGSHITTQVPTHWYRVTTTRVDRTSRTRQPNPHAPHSQNI